MRGISSDRPKVSLLQLFPSLDPWRGYFCDCDSPKANTKTGKCLKCGLRLDDIAQAALQGDEGGSDA